MFRKHKECNCDWSAIAYVKTDINLQLSKAIERVRMLHVKQVRSDGEYCGTCAYPAIWDEWQVWPCATIKALDSETNEA